MTRGLELCFAGSQLQGRHEAVPLSPFLNPPIPRTLEVHATVLRTACVWILSERQVNFKISWASNFGSKIWAKRWAKPNFSSRFLRVNGILKFTSTNLDFYFFVKGEEAWITVCLQLRAHEAKELPSILTIPCLPAVTRQSRSKAPDNVRGACNGASHYMRLVLKIYSKF